MLVGTADLVVVQRQPLLDTDIFVTSDTNLRQTKKTDMRRALTPGFPQWSPERPPSRKWQPPRVYRAVIPKPTRVSWISKQSTSFLRVLRNVTFFFLCPSNASSAPVMSQPPSQEKIRCYLTNNLGRQPSEFSVFCHNNAHSPRLINPSSIKGKRKKLLGRATSRRGKASLKQSSKLRSRPRPLIYIQLGTRRTFSRPWDPLRAEVLGTSRRQRVLKRKTL